MECKEVWSFGIIIILVCMVICSFVFIDHIPFIIILIDEYLIDDNEI